MAVQIAEAITAQLTQLTYRLRRAYICGAADPRPIG